MGLFHFFIRARGGQSTCAAERRSLCAAAKKGLPLASGRGLFACCARGILPHKAAAPLRPQKEIDSRCAGSLSLVGAASGPATDEMPRLLYVCALAAKKSVAVRGVFFFGGNVLWPGPGQGGRRSLCTGPALRQAAGTIRRRRRPAGGLKAPACRRAAGRPRRRWQGPGPCALLRGCARRRRNRRAAPPGAEPRGKAGALVQHAKAQPAAVLPDGKAHKAVFRARRQRRFPQGSAQRGTKAPGRRQAPPGRPAAQHAESAVRPLRTGPARPCTGPRTEGRPGFRPFLLLCGQHGHGAQRIYILLCAPGVAHNALRQRLLRGR